MSIRKQLLIVPYSNSREGIVFLGVIVVVAVFEFVGLLQPVRAVSERAMQPLLQASVTVVKLAQSPYGMARHAYNSARRIQDLEFRYAEVSAQLGELEALRQENQALRQALENPERPSSPAVIAAPLVSLAYPALAAGSQQGVQEGQMVMVANTLIGIIGQVSEHQSEVLLLTQAQHQPILARTETGVQGLVKGDGRQVLMTELPLDAQVKVGERVMTLGQVGIKRDVFIGRISRIELNPSSSVQTVVIEQLVSFYQARIVEVR